MLDEVQNETGCGYYYENSPQGHGSLSARVTVTWRRGLSLGAPDPPGLPVPTHSPLALALILFDWFLAMLLLIAQIILQLLCSV